MKLVHNTVKNTFLSALIDWSAVSSPKIIKHEFLLLLLHCENNVKTAKEKEPREKTKETASSFKNQFNFYP